MRPLAFASGFYCRWRPLGVGSPPMSAEPQKHSDTTVRRRQPLWPWLLMPFATLVIYFALYNARHTPAHDSAQPAPPAENPAAH